MPENLRLLLIEDSEDDALLLLRELRKRGYNTTSKRVSTAAAVTDALDNEEWDLIISDYVMPGFDGLEALALYRERRLNVPFIVVSGHIGEEIAVAAMQAGADDYLMKDRLARLVPAVERALQKADMRRAHHRASEALRESEERFRQLAENVGAVFFMFEQPTNFSLGTLSYVSPAFQAIWGFPCETLVRDPDLWHKSIHVEDRRKIDERLCESRQTRIVEEFRVVRMDMNTRWVHLRTFPVRNDRGEVYRIAAIAEDVTARKRSEEQLAAKSRQLEQTVSELRKTEEDLRFSNDELTKARNELEIRVQQRTAALAAANEELHSQMDERKRLETELLEIAENERRRIGFDLHDDLGQKLMGISMLLKALETNLRNKDLPEAAMTQEVQTLLHQVVNHTHNLAHCFSDLRRDDEELPRQLHKLAVTAKTTFHISCRFRSIGTIPPIPADASMQMYKIAQESISNAIKHGKAKRVSIVLSRRESDLVLRIKNDGVPYQPAREPSNRLGMRIMNYRAHLVGADFEIRPNGNCGTIVRFSLPCQISHAENSAINEASNSEEEAARSEESEAEILATA
jgi:PAS domain S-box-containing protein